MSPDAAQESLRDPMAPGCIKHPTDHSTSFAWYCNSANTNNPGQETVRHIPCSSHSYLLTHTVSHVLHKSPFKIEKRKTHLNSNFIVSDLCSVVISEVDQLGIQGSEKGWISWGKYGISLYECVCCDNSLQQMYKDIYSVLCVQDVLLSWNSVWVCTPYCLWSKSWTKWTCLERFQRTLPSVRTGVMFLLLRVCWEKT
jgi:hypothetical protein